MHARKRTSMLLLRLFVSLMLLCALFGCYVPYKEVYYQGIDSESVASVDLYDCRAEYDYKSDSYTEVDLNYIENKKEPAFTLDTSQIETFLNDLAEVRFYQQSGWLIGAVDPSLRFGRWVIRICFKDGSSMFLSDHGFIATYNAIGKYRGYQYRCDHEEWSSLIRPYIQFEDN